LLKLAFAEALDDLGEKLKAAPAIWKNDQRRILDCPASGDFGTEAFALPPITT
jgi:hypothetical protein